MRQVIRLKNGYNRYRKLMSWYKRDLFNRIRYGSESPISCERIYIEPSQVNRVIGENIFGAGDSGRVVGGDWDLLTSSIYDFPKYIICHERFLNGKSWRDAGAYELMLALINNNPGLDGCRSIEDIVERYKHLDKIYCEIKKHDRLMNRQEIWPGNFRERDGVYVHFDRDGNIIFGGGGCHRLAVSKILQLKVIPAQVGVVHEEALGFWRDRVTAASA